MSFTKLQREHAKRNAEKIITASALIYEYVHFVDFANSEHWKEIARQADKFAEKLYDKANEE